MPRVVVNSKKADLKEAVDACPVGAIKSVEGQFAVDPSACIDCGVCQGCAPEGSIVEDSEATDADKALNEELAAKA